ncbi:hypothetical protein CTI12_AA134980 [Artemisia annua]|uniref:Uncharacterized protein n=1 Tax=Artemisia annua TaxID=35608 RepID=A0A2U1PLK0_ARTAN|nr:hypothetical protein CTI12_AA134980 [Artemisia annua]
MSFLLEFLQVYYMREQGQKLELASRLSSVVDVSGKKLSHMTILRDVIKLENQIPLFLVQTMLKHQHTEKPAKETLQIMLMGLYRELSPFQYRRQSPNVDINNCDHILDFLYHMTIPTPEELGIVDEENESGGGTRNLSMPKLPDETMINVDITEAQGGDVRGKEQSFKKPSHVKRLLDQTWRTIKKTYSGFKRFVQVIMFSRAVILVLKVPWKIISSLPVLQLLKDPIENMLANFQDETNEKLDDESNETNPPLIEEITIPSVTEMVNAGIRFIPVKNGTISAIRFNVKTSTLYLPVVHLDVNTEVYLRNLVAYEACVASGPLVMARYTELMNGIIDTEEDAKYLMDRKIVLNHLKSDQEVADLWNGMSKSVKMTKVPYMDKVIEEVNKRYNGTWRVKLARFMATYVFGSWKFLTLFSAVFMLFLSTVQTFCSIYSCARVFKQLPKLDHPE